MNHTATYSPEDNKLRLYIGRVPREEYEALRAEGWKALHKQREAGHGDFVATWSPDREDTARSYLEEGEDIGDEDYSPEERAADRAERFSGYRDKRAAEAGAAADTFEAGPQTFGHQNLARAARQARRHDRHRTAAVSQWQKAEYWQTRTAGVIRHALHRSSAATRRGRILTLEAEQRKHEKGCKDPSDPNSYSARWSAHYELRLGYERAMLANEGGTAADAEMERGGWIGKHQIHKVNKSNATGRVVSVTLKIAGDRWGNTNDGYHFRPFNIERLPEGAYRAPTDAERQEFAIETRQRKAAEKAKKGAAPALVNPTDADAERLQSLWNAEAERKHLAAKSFRPFEPSQVLRMTQAQYSARSGGTYSSCETVNVTEKLATYWESAMGRPKAGRTVVFKVRVASSGGTQWHSAKRVIVLTDKPQKPIPWEACVAEAERQPSAASLRARLDELAPVVSADWLPEKDAPALALLNDAHYVGWVYIDSCSQFGWTDAGAAAYREHLASPPAPPVFEPVAEEANDRWPAPAGMLF